MVQEDGDEGQRGGRVVIGRELDLKLAVSRVPCKPPAR